ncbi:MAG: riboflavin synthase [Ignavibacteria bacterium]
MFTGIIQNIGEVVSDTTTGDSIIFEISSVESDFTNCLKSGDSIAVNGVCLTVTDIAENTIKFTAVKETLIKTNLGELRKGSHVNLEKAMSVDSKLDGHLVQGHIDTTGKVVEIIKNIDSHEFLIEFDSKFRDYIIKIGSICINGVSLTIADIMEENENKIIIKIAIIPFTYIKTIFQYLEINNSVNIEFDMMGKYIKRIFENSIK